jgi:hypothetical protein
MSGDLVGVLEHVRTACYDFDVAGNPFNIYWHALNRLVSTRQRRDEDGHSFRERLLTSMKRFEQVGGNMSGMINMDKDDENMSDERHSKILVQRLAAMMMFQQSDNVRYGTVKKDFYNDRLSGSDMYPTTWNGAAILLDNLKIDAKKEVPPGNAGAAQPEPSRSFVNQGNTNTLSIPAGSATGSDGSFHPTVRCHGCNKLGHYIVNCRTHPKGPAVTPPATETETEGATDPEKKLPVKGKSLFIYANSRVEEYEESDGAESDDEYGGEGRLGACQYTTVGNVRRNTCKMMSADALASNGVNFSTVGTEGKRKLVSLLDSGATHDIVKDPELLSKIWTSSEVLDVETNGGD